MDEKKITKRTKYFSNSHVSHILTLTCWNNFHFDYPFTYMAIIIYARHVRMNVLVEVKKKRENIYETYITVMIIRSTENCLCSKPIHISRLLIDEAKQIKMPFMGNADGEVNNFILTLSQSSTTNPQRFTSSPIPHHQIWKKKKNNFGWINEWTNE